MLGHWHALTQFLRIAGAPHDNNIAYAARGISDVMPGPGLCRVKMRSAPSAACGARSVPFTHAA
jgi:hypothetical protein